jgi:hypothetical protein
VTGPSNNSFSFLTAHVTGPGSRDGSYVSLDSLPSERTRTRTGY